jgi:DNA-binding CsgD family transcriptional regulator/PAS domain-containing protein
MLPDSAVLSHLLGSLYAAAADPTGWDKFLQQLARRCNAQSAALVMHDKRWGLHTLARNWEVDPEGTRLYQEHYGAVDVWAERAAGIPMQKWTGTSEQLCPATKFSHSEYYNDFLRPLSIEHAAFSLLERTSNREAIVGIYRSPRQKEFQASELDLLRFLAPHIRRAFSLHLHIADLKGRSGGMEAALDAIRMGVMLLDARGEILAMNRSATSITAQGNGLIVTREGLRAESRFESARLVKAIREAVTTSEGKGLNAAGSILVSRRKGASLQVLITPSGDSPIDVARRVCAIIFINDPEQRVRTPNNILRALFGLTPAECRVAFLIGDGRSPREVAQMLGISMNTLKSHTASVYAKTSTSRQSQLVRLLSTLPVES